MSSACCGASAQEGDDLDMRREEELIDWHDAGDAIAAVDQDAEISRKRSGVAGDAASFGTLEEASSLAWPDAPARGGSNTTAS
jgi:hypothetical protein